jgi:hypothetical protein
VYLIIELLNYWIIKLLNYWVIKFIGLLNYWIIKLLDYYSTASDLLTKGIGVRKKQEGFISDFQKN